MMSIKKMAMAGLAGIVAGLAVASASCQAAKAVSTGSQVERIANGSYSLGFGAPRAGGGINTFANDRSFRGTLEVFPQSGIAVGHFSKFANLDVGEVTASCRGRVISYKLNGDTSPRYLGTDPGLEEEAQTSMPHILEWLGVNADCSYAPRSR